MRADKRAGGRAGDREMGWVCGLGVRGVAGWLGRLAGWLAGHSLLGLLVQLLQIIG